jgi:autotransporter-associated beta strand protein
MQGRLTGANTTLNFHGPGAWTIAGGSGLSSAVQLIINSGVVNCARNANFAALSATTTLKSGGSLVMLSPTGTQLGTSTKLVFQGGLLEMLGDSETVESVTTDASGCIIRNSAGATTSTLTVTNGVSLVGTNCVFDVTNNASLVVAGVVSGTGSLLKTGAGLLNLSSNNTYTGNTTVDSGTLTLNSPFLAANSTVTVNTNGVLNLGGGATNTVEALVLGGASKPAGLYDSINGSPYLTGSGKLLVVPPTPPVNPLPGTIQFNLSGSTLTLAWPTNAGWILQSQTNSLSVGLVASSNAWFNVPGSDLVTTTNMTVNPTNGTVFYRMIHP